MDLLDVAKLAWFWLDFFGLLGLLGVDCLDMVKRYDFWTDSMVFIA
jgi:hypothetical protein